MTRVGYRRMKRYVAFMVVHAAVVALAVAGVFGDFGWLAVLVCALPVVWAWGLFQADLALNGALQNAARDRWRIAFWLLPWSMAAYWLRYVRPRRDGG